MNCPKCNKKLRRDYHNDTIVNFLAVNETGKHFPPRVIAQKELAYKCSCGVTLTELEGRDYILKEEKNVN